MLFIRRFKLQHRYALINAFKATIASLIGYVVGHSLGDWLNIPAMYAWIVVTILIVMSSQPNLGGATGKAVMRIAGTFWSVVIAIIILLLLPDFRLTQIMLCLIFIFIGVYIATAFIKYTYAGLLGALTLGIILFAKSPSITFALSRGLEVLLGIVIAVVITRFLFPIKASDRILHSYANSLFSIGKLHLKLTEGGRHDWLLSEIFSHFNEQISLQKEIAYEPEKVRLDHYCQTTYLMRQLYRYVCVVYEYIETYPEKRQRFTQEAEFTRLHTMFSKLLHRFADTFETHRLDENIDITAFQSQLEAFKTVFNMPREYVHVNTLIFSLDRLVSTLKEMHQMQQQLFSPRKG